MNAVDAKEYLSDPCSASSLPFWKIGRFPVPDGIRIVRGDEYDRADLSGTDEPYFKLMHDLKNIKTALLPEGYRIALCDTAELAKHINECYPRERVTADELELYKLRPVYDETLWIAAAEEKSGLIAASGIGEFDAQTGEGILEWIQVSPSHRRRGLGAFIVCSLLQKLRSRAGFVTVSGRLNAESDPVKLYLSCGFAHTVIWHVITRA